MKRIRERDRGGETEDQRLSWETDKEELWRERDRTETEGEK